MTGAAVQLTLEQFTLANGLQVVLAPDRRAPVVAVAVAYDVGTRSEPEGRSGFAHLFEHLMFQGSATLPKLAHGQYVQAAGGTFNAATHLDYTEFYQVLPSSGLERVLFCEADRMRQLALTEENLRNQVEVVKQEIRGTVHSRPYGGFPQTPLAALMFDTFPNAHDGYGTFTDLEAATVADARSFFARYYRPGNAVLCLAGDLDPDQAAALVERHFGDVPEGSVRKPGDWWEPDLTAAREHHCPDPLAPLPAFACGWRVPDPIADLPGLLPYVLLAELLAAGDLARLPQRLVRQDRCAVAVGGRVGLTGQWYTNREPCVLVLQVTLAPGHAVPAVRAALDEEVARVAAEGPDPAELARVRAMLTAQLLRGTEPLLGRARWLAPVAQQRGTAADLLRLAAQFDGVTAAQVAAAAGALVPARRATVVVEPGGAR